MYKDRIVLDVQSEPACLVVYSLDQKLLVSSLDQQLLIQSRLTAAGPAH